MTTRAELFQISEEARIACDYERAIEYGNRALTAVKVAADPSDQTIHHMMGVSCHMLGRFRMAASHFEAALVEADAVATANIHRDWGEACRKAGYHTAARDHIEQSINALNANDHPVEWAASRGFRARWYRDNGLLTEALTDFAVACEVLRYESNRHIELYIILHYASFLSQLGYHPVRKRQTACRAVWLAWKWGERSHKVRAFCLLIGGYRLEALVRERWQLK